MKKTIFSQFMKMCLIIILFCSVFMSSFSYVFIRNHLIDRETDDMTDAAMFVETLVLEILENPSDIENNFYILNINNIAKRTNSYVMITDSVGNVIFSSENYKVLERVVDISAFDKLVQGESQVKKGVFDRLITQKTVTVSVPVIKDGNLFCAVFLTLPVSYIYINGETLLKVFAFISVFAILASAILSYVLSVRIARPIKNLSLASREIAKGSFGKRVVSKSSIPEIQELESSFNSMAQALEVQIKRRTDFISNVSHDLRTPMTTICGFVEAVLDGTVTEEERERYLKIVLSETKRLSGLVNSLLDVEKYGDDGIAVIEKSEFDLNETIRTVILSLEKPITDKGLHIEFLYDGENSFVYASKPEIHRVVQNLVDNAIKFANEKGEIKIEVTRLRQKTITAISNTGKEISDEDKKFIFDRFYKSDQSRTDKNSGFGLGLYIVKSIILRHKENITVESENGVTTFKFTLPSV